MPHLLLDFSDFNKKYSLLFKLKEKRKKQTNKQPPYKQKTSQLYQSNAFL